MNFIYFSLSTTITKCDKTKLIIYTYIFDTKRILFMKKISLFEINNHCCEHVNEVLRLI